MIHHCVNSSSGGGALSGKSLSGSVQGVLVVSSELRVHTLQRRVSVGLRLLDAVLVGLSGLVVSRVVLGFGHFWLALSRHCFCCSTYRLIEIIVEKSLLKREARTT